MGAKVPFESTTTAVDETYLPFIPQMDIGQLQSQWTQYS